MDTYRFKSAVAQAYRWSLAGVVGSALTALEGLPILNPFTYIVGIPVLIGFIVIAAVIEYFIQGWIDPE